MTNWSKALGDSKEFNVSLEVQPLRKRFERLFQKKCNRAAVVQRKRDRALEILAQSQLHGPPPTMPLWQ